ncbi:MAG TPA: tetratricopeptide repeat protein [Longimicrobiales bacterium]|nr:tetratricopeptide repeat protein [Longimicrobiales bacterium]
MTFPRLVAFRALAVAAAAAAMVPALRPRLAGQAVPPTDTSADTAVAKTAAEVSDSLLAAGDTEASYAVLVARLGVFPDDFEARWRAARAALGLGIMGADADTRRYWLQEADAQGRALLHLRPDDPEAMAWAAAARGRRALAEPGARTVVALAEETWQLTGKLLAAHPDHPLGNHVRGKLHQEVARLPRVKRILARMFLRGDMLGQAKWELAEEHIQRAIAGDPGMVLFYLDLGETYRYQGKDAAALSMYRRGLAVPDRLPVDARFKSTMQRRIATLEGTAPGP